MNNKEVSDLFKKIAVAYQIKNEPNSKFKIIAYERASEEIKNFPTPLEKIWKEDRLDEVPGLGSSMISHVKELFTKGKVTHFEAVLREVPESIFPLLSVPGFGPKKAYKLVSYFKLNDPKTVIDDIKKLAEKGKIAPLEGFGEKSESDILESLEIFKKGQIKENRILLSLAFDLATDLVEYLEKCPAVKKAVFLGSLRRMMETIGDIDLAVSTEKPQEVLDYFMLYKDKSEIIEKGPTGASIRLGNGRQVDLRVVSPREWGSMVQYFTGSKTHNIQVREIALKKGYSLNEYGLKAVNKQMTNNLPAQAGKKQKIIEFESELDLYKALGLVWMPPELREGRGEVEAAKKNTLPDLVETKDIKGDLHIHTSFNIETSHDLGKDDILSILKKGDSLGYEYIGISDHNPSQSKHSEDRILAIMKARKQYYEHKLESIKSTRTHLFIMLETDIRPSGDLAIPKSCFEYIDASIVSVHSEFRMDKETMTERVLKGLSHPKARILAHPTGRLLTGRPPFELNWEKLFEFCQKNDKAVEINASPYRLDLSDIMIRQAIQNGVRLIINTDSHSEGELDNMKFGVSQARRGWAEKNDILNTLPYNEFKRWLLL